MAGPQENWDEQKAVTGRPNDEPLPNTTFAERAAARKAPQKKAVQADDGEAENKAVSSRRVARKSSK